MYLFAKQTKKAPKRSKGICLDSVGQSNKPHFWIELDRASSACKGHLIYSLRLTGMDLSPPNTTTGGRPFLRLFTRKVTLGSRNRKRDWPGVILNERGHGGSRDRKQGWITIFAQSARPSISVTPETCWRIWGMVIGEGRERRFHSGLELRTPWASADINHTASSTFPQKTCLDRGNKLLHLPFAFL